MRTQGCDSNPSSLSQYRSWRTPSSLELSGLPPGQTLSEATYFKFPSTAPVPHVYARQRKTELPTAHNCYTAYVLGTDTPEVLLH